MAAGLWQHKQTTYFQENKPRNILWAEIPQKEKSLKGLLQFIVMQLQGILFCFYCATFQTK